MASRVLYTYQQSHNNVWANKIAILSHLIGKPVEIKISPEFETKEFSEEFKSKFSHAKCVAFEDGSLRLTDCEAILVYLLGKDLSKDPVIVQFLNFAASDIHNCMSVLCYPALGLLHPDKLETQYAQNQLREILSCVEAKLKKHDFIHGETHSIVDIAFFCELLPLYEMYLDAKALKEYTCVEQWIKRCAQIDCFKTVIGDIVQCSKPASFNGELYSKIHGSKKGDKKEKGDKAQKDEKKGQKKSEQKPKNTEAEKTNVTKPKSNDPFSSLPPTTFDLELWKRTYCNNDALSHSLPWLWENLDYEGFSFWHASYKYSNELAVSWKIENFILGLFRRLDSLRKHAFAVLHLCGTGQDGEGNYDFSGVWLLRGPKLAFELHEDWNDDTELFDFKHLDPKKPEEKQVIEDYFSKKVNIGSRPLIKATLFK